MSKCYEIDSQTSRIVLASYRDIYRQFPLLIIDFGGNSLQNTLHRISLMYSMTASIVISSSTTLTTLTALTVKSQRMLGNCFRNCCRFKTPRYDAKILESQSRLGQRRSSDYCWTQLLSWKTRTTTKRSKWRMCMTFLCFYQLRSYYLANSIFLCSTTT